MWPPIQIFAGDLHGINTLEHQPAKIAAMEGHFETHEGAPLILFGIPNTETETIDYAIEIPYLGSLILTHTFTGEVKGLKEWPEEDRPPVGIIFWSFRIMVIIGLAMAALGIWSLWLRWRQDLYDTPWMHRAAVLMGPMGFVAVLAGWITTEVGRQPWTVYGLLRTSESISPIAAEGVAVSLAAFIVVYSIVFVAGVRYMLILMAKPPEDAEALHADEGPSRTGGRMATARKIEEASS